jgi:hypothetical protein
VAFNDLPAALQSVIQQGFLERMFRQPLRAQLGFRAIADKEPFTAAIGETISKTRAGLLVANTTPMAPASLTDFTSGLTAQNYSVERFTLGIAQYAVPMLLNIVTSKVAIDSVFLQNAVALAENAFRSVDLLAQRSLFDFYMGGNTRVRTTNGSAGTTVNVDDVRGFFMSWDSTGVPQPTSSSNPLTVTVGADSYTLNSVVADGTAPATISPWLSTLTFSGSNTNVSTTPGGYSGVLTFSANVTTADATALQPVVAAVAPAVFRPFVTSTGVMAATSAAISSSTDNNNGQITMQMLLRAKATLRANAVPPVTQTGNYVFYADPLHLTGLYQDPAFQYFFRGKPETAEYRKGIVTELLQMDIVETNLNPVQSLSGNTIHRGVLCGQGALVEAEFTSDAYAGQAAVDDGNMITVIDGIAHITREPLDALKQVVTQSWAYIGGFVAPTDTTTTTNTIPTASNAAWKRAAIIESF